VSVRVAPSDALLRIVLVGLPGAGKSTVGRLVAERLGWEFVDLDAEIERQSGRSVAALFAERGEAGFRDLETAVTREVAARRRLVVATGGGWVEHRANLDALETGALTVFLRVSPSVAAARLGAQGGGRPLLATPNPEKSIGELLARREAIYLQAQHTVSVDTLSADEAASYIVALACA
jgi:shikimate kinase